MNDYKLKLIATLLSAVVFALFFIILAFVVPTKEKPVSFKKLEKPKSKLEEISKSFKEKDK